MCGRRYHHHRTTTGPTSLRTTRIKADDVRASDAEREETITALRTHAGDGRLDVEELDQRIEAAYAAKTRRELTALTDDLRGRRVAAPGDDHAATSPSTCATT